MTESLSKKGKISSSLNSSSVNAWQLAAQVFWNPRIDLSEGFLKRMRNWGMVIVFVIGIFLSLFTIIWVQEYLSSGVVTTKLVVVLLCDILLCFIIIVFAVYQFIRRKLKSSGQAVSLPLSLKLLRHLTILSLMSAILTAGVGVISIFVLGETIVNQIKEPVEGASNAANSYINNQYLNQAVAIKKISDEITNQNNRSRGFTLGELRQVLQQVHRTSGTVIDNLFIIDREGRVMVRGQDSYIFDCDTVAPEAFTKLDLLQQVDIVPNIKGAECYDSANLGNALEYRCLPVNSERMDVTCGQNQEDVSSTVYRRIGSDKLYSLTWLQNTDYFVYGQSQINLEILNLYVASQLSTSVELIGRLGFEILNATVVYLIALGIILLLLQPLVIRIARRISQPAEELSSLVDRVDNFGGVIIPEFKGDDEIAKLGRSFKDMLGRLENRQEELELQYKESEAEKRKFDSVLTTVSSGVIGLDSSGCVAFYNNSAQEMLQSDFGEQGIAKPLSEAAPAFHKSLGNFLNSSQFEDGAQKKITLVRRRDTIELFVRIANWQQQALMIDGTQEEKVGLIISVVDVTKLTESERAALAVEAAKQVAHDLKSPLQAAKISLSNIEFLLPVGAQKTIQEPLESVEHNLNRVTNLVNRFQIPGVLGEVRLDPHNVSDVISQFTKDVQSRYTDIDISISDNLDSEIIVGIDKRSLQDVFENLISNSWEAIDDQRKLDHVSQSYRGKIHVSIQEEDEMVNISVSDNGIGLSKNIDDFLAANVSTKGPNRGKGLVIVESIVRKHKGEFSLFEAPQFEGCTHNGAQAQIRLPIQYIDAV